MPHNRKQNSGSTAVLWLHTSNLVSFLCETTFMLHTLLLEGLFSHTWWCLSNIKWCAGHIAFWCQVCILAKWQPHLLLFVLITLSLRYEGQYLPLTLHPVNVSWKIFAVLSKDLWNLSQFILKFFVVILTTKTTAILGALHTFICPLLWRISLYRTQSI